jgi:hypothetical protein
MVLVENVLNREFISYTKLKRVRYSRHNTENEKESYMEQHIIENVMPTSAVSKEVWQKLTRCENFKTIENKDGAVIIVLIDVTHKIGDY